MLHQRDRHVKALSSPVFCSDDFSTEDNRPSFYIAKLYDALTVSKESRYKSRNTQTYFFDEWH